MTGGVVLHASKWASSCFTSSFCGPWWGWFSWASYDPWGCWNRGWRSWWTWRWCNLGWTVWPWRPVWWCDPIWIGTWCWPSWSNVVYVPGGTTVIVEAAEPATEVVYVDSEPAPPEPILEEGEGIPGVYRAGSMTTEAITEKYVRLGDLYFRAGRYDRAAWAYQRAVEQSPGQGSLHFLLADALFAMGDYHYAAFAIRRGIEKDPSLVESRADKRTFYPDPETFEGQLASLERFLGDHPRDTDAWLVLGYNRFFSGAAPAAVEALRKAQELGPGDEAIRLLLASADLRAAEEALAPSPPAPGEPR